MSSDHPLRIGITCYPSVGGSGILASSLGVDLARRGHDVHFISYERPFRLPADVPRVRYHPVGINAYGLFKYPDYTLPLSVKMAELSREHRLDLLHVHYAVPHATAAVLARSMLPPELRPKVVATLHGTDTCSAATRATARRSATPWSAPTPSLSCRNTSATKPAAYSASTGRSTWCTTTSSRARHTGRVTRSGTSSA